jgi:hypothetical protein
MKRRHFLEFAGSLLATLGVSQIDLHHRALQYARGVVAATPRKLALLVGINEYPAESGQVPLQGCVTDVELQRELLVSRFGFNPADIVVLTDAKATRGGILTAFEEHLIKQAKPGDAVVFHYSGHGSRIVDPDRDHSDGTNSTFVPIDSSLPAGFPEKGGIVQDITGHTLFLLMEAVQSDNLTVVLDSCHSGGGTRGNLRIRSRDGGIQLEASPDEYAYRQQWLSRLNLSPAEFIARRRAGVARGAVLAGAGRDQLAADADFNDFAAGMFSYLLTQYLWQQTENEPIARVFPNLSRSTTRQSSSGQQPLFEVQPNSGRETRPIYVIDRQKPPADGAILQTANGDRARLWLGGIDPRSLESFGRGSRFSVMGEGDIEVAEIELQSRQGLLGEGKIVSGKSEPGLLLQEKIRGIPSDSKLIVGLDNTLSKDTATAKQALESLSFVRAVPLLQGEVHYILGRFTSADARGRSSANPPTVNSLGLFSPGRDPIPDSFGPAGETAASAVTRLQAKLKSLLAARMARSILNTDSSRLNLEVAMNPEGSDRQLIARVFPTRGIGQGAGQTPAAPVDPRRLPIGTPVQFQISNRETSDLYISLLVIDPAGEMSIVFPNNWTASEESTRIAAGKTIRVPEAGVDTFQLVVQEPKGTVEVLILASRAPLRQGLKALQGIARSEGQARGPVSLTDPASVIGDLLDDVAPRSRGSEGRTRGIGVQARLVDTSQFAAMSLTFEVI